MPKSGTNLWIAAAIVIFCIALSAFFSGSETALTAASRARMHALQSNGDKRASLVMRLLGNRDRLIGAILLGNTLASIGSSALLTSVLEALVGINGVIYATGLMTVLLLVFAEVLPKTLAINFPDRTALSVAPVISFFVAIFGPSLPLSKRLCMRCCISSASIYAPSAGFCPAMRNCAARCILCISKAACSASSMRCSAASSNCTISSSKM